MQTSQKLKPDQIESYTNYYISLIQPSPNLPPSLPEPTSDHLENCKYLIKSLNNLSLDPGLSTTQKPFKLLSKALKLSTSLYKLLKISSKSSENFTNFVKIRSLTLNNLACYFKSCDKMATALSYLQKAAKLEKKCKVDDYEVSTTLLNLTAVLSKMGNHEKAVEYALEAVRLLETVDELKPVPEVLTTAYYNYAVELEFLDRTKEAKVFYEKAWELSQEKLGEKHSRTQNFLDKLAEFNFSHPSLQTTATAPKSTASFASTTNKSPDSTQSNVMSPLNLLLTVYKYFGNIKFKVFVINKPAKLALKVLAFPKEKYPVYRMLVKYNEVPISCVEGEQDLREMENDDLANCARKLVEKTVIERGALKIADRARPVSAYDRSFKSSKSKGK